MKKKSNTNSFIKSLKYNGVFSKIQSDGAVALYIFYTNEKKQYNRYKVGIKSKSLTEYDCWLLRNEAILNIKLKKSGVFSNKEVVYRFDEIAEDALKMQEGKGFKEAEKNRRKYLYYFKNHFKNMDISLITKEMIFDFKHERLQSGLSEMTVYSLVTLLGVFFNHARDVTGKYKERYSPTHQVFTRKPKNARTRYLTKEQVFELLNEIAKLDSDIAFYLDMFVRISVSCGSRVNSTLKIKRGDVDGREVKLWDGKNKEYYAGWFSKGLISDELLEKFLKGKNTYEYLFVYRNIPIAIEKIGYYLRPIYRRLFNAEILEYIEKELEKPYSEERKNNVLVAKRELITSHSLRHSCASIIYNNDASAGGGDIFLVSKILNHKRVEETSKRYTHALKSKNQFAVDHIIS